MLIKQRQQFEPYPLLRQTKNPRPIYLASLSFASLFFATCIGRCWRKNTIRNTNPDPKAQVRKKRRRTKQKQPPPDLAQLHWHDFWHRLPLAIATHIARTAIKAGLDDKVQPIEASRHFVPSWSFRLRCFNYGSVRARVFVPVVHFGSCVRASEVFDFFFWVSFFLFLRPIFPLLSRLMKRFRFELVEQQQ